MRLQGCPEGALLWLYCVALDYSMVIAPGTGRLGPFQVKFRSPQLGLPLKSVH